MVATTGATFLGLTVDCARCHDHKFDPITQEDYYGLQAVFAGVQHGERDGPPPDAERRRREAAQLARRNSPRSSARLDELEPLADADGAARAGRRSTRAATWSGSRPVAARFVRFTVDGHERRTRAVHRRAGDLHGRADAAQRRPGRRRGEGDRLRRSTRTAPSTSSNTSTTAATATAEAGSRNEPGKGWVQIELPRPDDDRPRRLGPRPRGEVQRPAGRRLPHRGGRRARHGGRWSPRRRTACRFRQRPSCRSRRRASRSA